MTQPPQAADTDRGLNCPTCDTGLLKATRTYRVGPSSRVRRVKCDNPRCNKVMAVFIGPVEGISPDRLASGIRAQRLRPMIEKALAGTKLRFRL